MSAATGAAPAAPAAGVLAAPPPSPPSTALAGLFGRDAVYTLLWAVQLLAAALVTPWATRLMESAQFGALAAANAVMQVLFVLAGAGLATAVQREHARGDARRARALLWLAVGSALAVGLLAHATGPLWSGWLGLPGYTALPQLTVAWATTSALTNAGLALLRSDDRLGAFTAVSLLQSVVAEAGSLLVLVLWRGSGATGFVVGQVTAQVLAVGAVLLLAPPSRPRRSDVRAVGGVLAFALPLVPVALGALVLGTADRLVLGRSWGPEALGGYQVAVNIASAPMLLMGVLATSWMPRLFSLDGDRPAVLSASRDALLVLLVPVVVGLGVGGPVVLRVWAPASYGVDALSLVFTTVVVAALPFAAGAASSRRLVVAGRTGVVAVGTAVAAAVDVVALLVLVPPWGAQGAALATVVALTAQAAALGAAARGVLTGPRTPARLLLAVSAACAAALLSALLPVSGAAATSLRLLVAAVCLVACGAVLRRLQRGHRPAGDGLR